MRKVLVLLVVGLVGLMVVACGGTAAETGPEPVSLSFTGGDDFRYDPATAAVAAGAPVTVAFNNIGVLEHNWLLVGNDVDPLTATPEDAVNGATSGIIAGGTSATFNFTAPAPGTYQYVCTVPGHAAGGMVGSMTVSP